MKKRVAPQSIEILLPHTQCGDCGFDGCAPYALAISQNKADINKCAPGGYIVMNKIAHLLEIDVGEKVLAYALKPRQMAKIHAQKCIGCSICVKACPVDAILGAPKQEHVILTDICNGCELCVVPCPTECISMVQTTNELFSDDSYSAFSTENKKRCDAKTLRLATAREHKIAKKEQNSSMNANAKLSSSIPTDKLEMIAAARAKAKQKLNKK